jgi:isopropylmalate/isohomocitrate dehydrogenase-like protein
MARNEFTICVLAGDGIGPEVTGCARRVLESLAGKTGGPAFTFVERSAGCDAYEKTGEALSSDTLDAAKAADAVLVGAFDVARMPQDAMQPLHAIRHEFDVHASVRPSRSYSRLNAPYPDIDVVVVREVTEGIYSGIEYRAGPDAACAVRLITRKASARTAEIAFKQASERRRKVTAVHKLGALKITDSLFLEAVRSVAEKYPDVTLETRNIDACALELIRHPGDFDVILATNTFGDILSDVAAGVAGGLGLAPSSCIGARWAYFEPVHGTAPDIAGKGIANPIATILSTAMMLRYLGVPEAADTVERAVAAVLADGPRTGDLGGKATSAEVTDAVIAALAA